ncbi:Cell wall-associated hydrolase, NlpC family [Parafrankia irregularis]|uniref:Cell wall-associated hydrolase, NlpC family n=1 Tax=Parafrankia irregularis TaxID=795642 RepID=A0A0S4QX05_9ACTN|nr:C40 family peptidase [Parafrankia irregularis]MBE3203479.1 C40 family peptidase [Parafrankia sp. CH37]CUU60161.1 Cell wall-associated hydrolase, NlpC family [Parafrankia irregularis]
MAAVTTGTVAVSGVALAGCAPDTNADAAFDEASNTAPMTLATQIGSRLAVDGAIQVASVAGSGSTTVLDATTDISAPTLSSKVDVGLRVTNPEVTVNANEPVNIGFSLYDEQTKAPLADQLIKVQVKLPTGWATFLHLTTDDRGQASYTARVLTTTNVTAIFDGTDSLQSAHSENDATLTVRPPVPAQASRQAVRSAVEVETPVVSVNVGANTIGEKAVYLASLQAGKPYIYGAEGPNSFDCSGLVQYVYKQLGKSVPRTTDQQYAATTHISQYNKAPGDLIFFGTPGNIYHVGIYAGDGKMWVAPHSGDVVKLQTIYTTSYMVGRVA